MNNIRLVCQTYRGAKFWIPQSNFFSYNLLKIQSRLRAEQVLKIQNAGFFTSSLKFEQKVLHKTSRYQNYEEFFPEDEEFNWKNFKNFLKFFKESSIKLVGEMKNVFAEKPFVRSGDVDVFMEFKDESSLKNWALTSDSIFREGFSSCTLTISPAGKGLFSGYIDTTVPKDGRVMKAGYCNISTVKRLKSFNRDHPYEWDNYSHLMLRIRGDGRTYMIILNTPGIYDFTFTDVFVYPLPTRGGPYWQDVKIEFSKFIKVAHGRVQDNPYRLTVNNIHRVGISLVDNKKGPFRLEIDHISTTFHEKSREDCAYEEYKTPPYYTS